MATTLYVTNATDAGGDGSLASPFGSLQGCVNTLGQEPPGSSCLLLPGVFRLNQTVTVQGLHGTSGAEYTIGAAEGAGTVTLDGTLDVDGLWVREAGPGRMLKNGTAVPTAHWSTPWPDAYPEPWQLFVNGEMQTVARWPNARWDDRTVFLSDMWAHGMENSTYCGDEQRGGNPDGNPCRLVDATHDHPTDVSLAQSCINATGAAAVLNIGHWYSFAGFVTGHTQCEGAFTYSNPGDWKATKYVAAHDLYFLEGPVALLDAPTEWSYDASTRRIHLASLGDADPAGLRVAARVQEYAIAATDCSNLRFSGLGFFATALYAAGEGSSADQDLHDVTFDSLIFDFPSAQKRLLGDGARSWPVTLLRKRTSEEYGAANLTLFNCSFYGAESHPQVNSQGSGVLFENNLFRWSDWTAVTTKPQAFFDPSQESGAFGKYGSGAMTIEMDRSYVPWARNVLRRNSVFYGGPSVGIAITARSVTAELNHVAHLYAIQEDGGLMQMSGLDSDEPVEWKLINERNWLHDALEERSTKWGLRFDRVNRDCYGRKPPGADRKTWGLHGTMHRNVVWNCNGVMVKGNNHTITHNTIFATDPLNFESDGQARDLALYSWENFGTCECDDAYCLAMNETCCVPGVPMIPRHAPPHHHHRQSSSTSRLTLPVVPCLDRRPQHVRECVLHRDEQRARRPRRCGRRHGRRAKHGCGRRAILGDDLGRQLRGRPLRPAARPRQPRLPTAARLDLGGAQHRRVRGEHHARRRLLDPGAARVARERAGAPA